MKIQGQSITERNDHLEIKIQSPYWGAFKRFGWTPGEWGIGLSIELIKYAKKNKKKIFAIYKDRVYKTTPKRIRNFYIKSEIKPIMEKSNVELVVIPHSLFTVNKPKEIQTKQETTSILDTPAMGNIPPKYLKKMKAIFSK